MKRSVKQARREAVMSDAVRARELRKQTEADMAFWYAVGGRDAWQRELNRRRKARNERTREHTRQVMAAKRAAAEAEPQQGLWAA